MERKDTGHYSIRLKENVVVIILSNAEKIIYKFEWLATNEEWPKK